ncbi:MAG: DUF58 domain-containing protein [Oligoflexia bacterium]|nr:DUF58 domain-containing protein [Oligoflexia bacterium]
MPSTALSAALRFEGAPARRTLLGLIVQVPLLFSARGFLLLLLATVFVVGPVRSDNDIVASVLSYSLLISLSGFGIMTLTQALRLRRSVSMQAYPPDTDGSVITAGTPCRVIIRTTPVSILPFFSLKVSAEFDQEALPSMEHRITGSSDAPRTLAETIMFPHRGLWRIRCFHLTLEDRLGLSYVNWSVLPPSEASTLRVTPQPHSGRSFPVLSSSERPGDLYQDSRQRMGDPLDLKRYHPSDGLKKIVWKIFARAGELVSRHAENSMTPEGQVVVYVLAGPADDDACSAALNYLETLEELRLEALLGCDGMGERALARTRSEAEEILIDSTWDSVRAESQAIDAFSRFLESCRTTIGDGFIRRVLIFTPRSSLANPILIKRCELLGQFLEQQQIIPTFALGGFSSLEDARALEANSSIRRWFFSAPASASPATSREGETLLTRLCLQRAWEVFS